MSRRPNLLFILADQFRAMCLDRDGDPVSTPVLDRLAAQGTSLRHAVSSYPVCSPHRAMMMTGQYPDRNAVTHNVNSETAQWGVGLRPEAPSWAEVLRTAGYNTGYIGKWHLQAPVPEDAIHGAGPLADGRYWDAYSPVGLRHGFDFWHSYGCCDRHLTPHYWTGDAGRDECVTVAQWSAAHETDVALDFLVRATAEACQDAPFALVVSFNPPHQPFNELPEGHETGYAALPPDVLLNRPNVDLNSEAGREAGEIAPLYYAAVAAIDEQVGRLMDAVDELGLAEDTVVVFTSDHGQQMGSHGLLYKNVPYEESMRIPFVVRWPGRIRADTDHIGLSSVDIAPTLLGMLGFAEQIPAAMEGRDVSTALLRGAGDAKAPPSALYFYYPRDAGDVHIRGLRTAEAKVVARFHHATGLTVTLYDLASDPFEVAPIKDAGLLREYARHLGVALTEAGQVWAGAVALEDFARAMA